MAESKSSKKKSKPKKNRDDSKENKSRRAAIGDVAPSSTAADIERFVVDEAVSAAQEAKINAVIDIIGNTPPYDVDTLARVLKGIMDGTSTDDAAVLRNALLRQPQSSGNGKPAADDALATNWQDGVYPYKNLMTRKNYEKEKYKLQVELLKLQSWVRKTGQKLVVLFWCSCRRVGKAKRRSFRPPLTNESKRVDCPNSGLSEAMPWNCLSKH